MNKRYVGSYYENVAEEFLKKKGYIILDKNYRCRFGEIDIICKDNNELVFVEVKYRSSLKYGEPAEAVTMTKQRKICKTASYYVMSKGYGEDIRFRFDVIGIIGGDTIGHFENAFEYII